MGNKLYVGNLSYNVGDSELEQLFASFGTVSSAKIITDRTLDVQKVLALLKWERMMKPVQLLQA